MSVEDDAKDLQSKYDRMTKRENIFLVVLVALLVALALTMNK